jgi:uncharacterized protein (DUF433 family)
MATVSVEHIEITPGICGGKPWIAGHRITVANIVAWHEQMRMSVRQIVETYHGITPADVHAALAYYHDHWDAIEAPMKADEELVAEMKGKSRRPLLITSVGQHDAKVDL